MSRFLLCALTGTFGILTGFAVFILTWEEQTTLGAFLGILLIVAIFATAFEYVRGVIEGSERPLSLAEHVTRLFLLAIFELFITAIHTSLSNVSHLADVSIAVLGPSLAVQSSAVVNMGLMALLWIFIGAAMGGALSLAIGNEKKGAAATIGLSAGALGAPFVVFCYLVLTRFAAEVSWMLAKPDEWAQNLQNLHDRVGGWLLPVKVGAGLMLRVYSWHHGVVGLVLASFVLALAVAIVLAVLAATKERNEAPYLWVLAVPVAIFGAPIVGPSLYEDIRNVGMLLLLVAVVWGVPGLLMGLGVPYLREPSRNRKTWAAVALLACAVLLLYAYLIQSAWAALLAAILFLAAVTFWRKGSVEEYWPLVALSIATIVLGITKVTVSANFLYIQDISRGLLAEPLSKVAPPSPPAWELKFSDLATSPLWREMSGSLNVEDVQHWRQRAANEIAGANTVAQEANQLVGDLRAAVVQQAEIDAMLAARLNVLGIRNLPELASATEKTSSMLAQSTKIEKKLDDAQTALGQLKSGPALFSISDVFARRIPPEISEVEPAINRAAVARSQIESALAPLRATPLAAMQQRVTELRDRLAQQFELCLTGSFGFWVTLGLLAGWSRWRHAY